MESSMEELGCLIPAEDPSQALAARIISGGRTKRRYIIPVTICTVLMVALAGVAFAGGIPTVETGKLVALYTPSLHARAVKEAFDASYETKGHVQDLIKRIKHPVQKLTAGTCAHFSCNANRGPTDCLRKTCLCKYGYETKDGEKCVKMLGSSPTRSLSEAEKETSKAEKETSKAEKETSKAEKDTSKAGKETSKVEKETNKVEETKCGWWWPFSLFLCGSEDSGTPGKQSARQLISQMLVAGSVEPDEMPCPGSTMEMASQVLRMIRGTRKYNVGLCRLSIQVYHGSPLPLVYGKQLKSKANDHGDTSEDNVGKNEDLFSVNTNRQWRTSMIQMLAKQFVYAVAMPDEIEAARHLGNTFHTLTDTWSASHVVRQKPDYDSFDAARVCGKFSIKRAISMDTVNWALHALADNKDDDLWKCGKFYVEKAIEIWAQLRAKPVTSAAEANTAIDRLVKEVLCPAFPLDEKYIDKPAGGAPEGASSSWFHGKAVRPQGTASISDAERLVGQWDVALQQEKDGENYGINIFAAKRGVDACETSSAAHVASSFVEEARDGKAPNYIVPAPGVKATEALKEGAKDLRIAFMYTDNNMPPKREK